MSVADNIATSIVVCFALALPFYFIYAALKEGSIIVWLLTFGAAVSLVIGGIASVVQSD